MVTEKSLAVIEREREREREVAGCLREEHNGHPHTQILELDKTKRLK